MIPFLLHAKQIQKRFVRDEITVYAAQASFFIVLSSFPFVMLLLSVIQLVPSISQEDFMFVCSRLLPPATFPLVESIINDIYTPSPAAILSATSIATLWSASRGMLGIERGLNRITGCKKRRGYLVSRIVSSGYTIVFMIICMMSLIFLVFGSALQKLLTRYIPIIGMLSPYLLSIRSLTAILMLIFFFLWLYAFLPYENQPIKKQIPGALFSTCAWILFSYGFSIYFSNFDRFSYMYGSLTAVVILMLWVYFCICILFLGAEINFYFSNNNNVSKS